MMHKLSIQIYRTPMKRATAMACWKFVDSAETGMPVVMYRFSVSPSVVRKSFSAVLGPQQWLSVA